MTELWPYAKPVGGRMMRGWHPAPDLAAGNAQFFDPNPACLVQLRPLLQIEIPAVTASDRPNGLLYAWAGVGSELATFLKLPPKLLTNDRAGIMNAIGCVARIDAATGLRLREVATRTRWPRLPGTSWTG